MPMDRLNGKCYYIAKDKDTLTNSVNKQKFMKILIVEDEPKVASFIKKGLGREPV